MKRVLLDTNAYSAYLNGAQDILQELSKADFVFISVIVLGELYAGFRGGKKYQYNKEILAQFLSKSTVEIIQINEETSEIFGQVKNKLKKSGTPLPINDIWIASQAIESGSVLITLDKHFTKISGIRLWNEY